MYTVRVKLYLSSYRIPYPPDLQLLIGKSLEEVKTAVIPNARDYNLPEERAVGIDEIVEYLAELKISADVIDLRDYDDANMLNDTLSKYDFIWVAGGNTYVLRAEMHKSGFDVIIGSLIESGKVYGGESAGAIVAGETLEGSDIADEAELASEIIQEGLKLSPRIFVPHADSAEYIEYVNHMKKVYKDDPRIVYLRDSQVFIANGSEEKIISAN